MLEFEARADYRGADIHDFNSIQAIGLKRSKAEYVKADDLGLTHEVAAIRGQVEQFQSVVAFIAGLTVLGLAGSIVAALDFVLDTVTVPGLQPLIERGFGCDPDGTCLIILGLPLPVFAGMAISGAASLAAIFGYLHIRMVKIKELRRAGYEIVRHSRSVLSERFVYLGSGQLTYSFGDAGIRLSIGGRIAIFEWSTFDGTLLLNENRDNSIWPDADPALLDGPELDLLFAPKQRSDALEGLLKAARTWSQRNAYIDLPLRLDLSLDAHGKPYAAGEGRQWREVLRIHGRYFHGAGDNYVSWANFIAACAFMISQRDPNFTPVGEGVR